MKLSIIIINYNVYPFLKNCLNSIYGKVTDSDYEIIVADNNSSHRDIESIKIDFPQINFIQLPQNLGFAKANNIAAKNASGDHFLFLNPDTILADNFITPIIKYIKDNNTAGACAPMLLNEDLSYQSSSGPAMGFKYEYLEAINLINTSRRLQTWKYLENKNTVHETGWVSAACMMIRKEVFLKVNGFTETYFLNYEDIDLCYKLNRAGYKNYFFPWLNCVHLDHKSFNTDYDTLVYSRYKSRLEFAKLHYSILKRLIVRLLHIVGLIYRILFISIFYSGKELSSRRTGYSRALKLYFGIIK